MAKKRTENVSQKGRSLDDFNEELSYSKQKELDEQDEPSWYHYAIILACVVLFFVGLYYVFADKGECKKVVHGEMDTRYKCPVQIHGRSGSVEFLAPIEEVRKYNYISEVSKLDVLNSKQVILSFDEYNGTDNGQVALVSTRVTGVLKALGFPFSPEKSFATTDTVTCHNSSLTSKVVLFKPYETENGIFFNVSNGCISIKGTSVEEFQKVGDQFLQDLVEGG